MLQQTEMDALKAISDPVLAKVHPVLAKRVMDLIETLAFQDLAFGAFMGLRTFAEQDALYAQGRTTTGTKIVTNAKGGQSWHNFGLAVDMVEDGSVSQAGIQWSWARNVDYLKIGAAAKTVGLEWGGFWKSLVDYPHVQCTAGLTLDQANVFYEQGLLAVWAEVDRRLAAQVAQGSQI